MHPAAELAETCLEHLSEAAQECFDAYGTLVKDREITDTDFLWWDLYEESLGEVARDILGMLAPDQVLCRTPFP